MSLADTLVDAVPERPLLVAPAVEAVRTCVTVIQRLILLAVAAAALTGCTGNGCDRLPALTAERDAARAGYSELVRSGTATTEQTEQGDAETHALDRQVYDLERSCG